MATPNESSILRKRAVTAAAVAGAFIGAAGIAGAAVNATSSPTPTLQSNAVSSPTDSETTATDATTDTAADANDADGDGRGDHVSTEEALTGDIADQVTAAALAAVPGGTIDRVESDDGGAAYEAHMTDADGNEVVVTFDENVTLIEVSEGGPGGHGGRGGHDGGPGGHGAEEALTGDVADQVTAAALAAVPGGTVDRVETDGDGATYEAHMTDADGNEVNVTFDANMAVVEIIQGR